MKRRTTWQTALACSTVAALLCPHPARAAAETEPTLDELLDITPDKRPSTRQVAPDVLDAVPEDQRHTLDDVARRMRRASQRLGQNLDPGLDTQRLQASILARLDQMIEAAERQERQSGGSPPPSGGNPQDSAKQQDTGSDQNVSQAAGQPGQKADGDKQAASRAAGTATPSPGPSASGAAPKQDQVKGPLRQTRVEWGNLPPRLRDELLQGVNERSSALYRRLTDAYFRRLAEESE